MTQTKKTVVTDEPKEVNPSGFDRRKFLMLSATGVASTLTGCAINQNTSQPAQITEDAGIVPVDSDPLEGMAEAGDLVNPANMPTETWQEPWVWRPERWRDSCLELNVVEFQNPGDSTSPGDQGASLFSYGGTSPGPTVRVKSDGTVRFRVRNHLDQNQQNTPVGPAPDPLELVPAVRNQVISLIKEQVPDRTTNLPDFFLPFIYPEQVNQVIPVKLLPGWNLGGHINGLHGAHTTNLHTHGLHVEPQRNKDGSHSDNLFLRIIPQADWEARKAVGNAKLDPNEHVGELEYKIQLSFDRNGQQMPHPPGTHWYHPHSHGATHDQVASGMAGFLIIEGDVDEAINKVMTGDPSPDPELKTGRWDYRERLIFLQRVFVAASDLDAGPKRGQLRFPQFPAVNGLVKPRVIRMRPGAVERWRVLNGSVDGAGTKRFMVLKGQYTQKDGQMYRVETIKGEKEDSRRLIPVTDKDYEENKLDLHQLAIDGITRVVERDGKVMHEIKDLSRQNAGTTNPYITTPLPGESDAAAQLRGFEAVFKDGESLRQSFVRPNEVYMVNANRTDILFKAPLDSVDQVFTIFAREAHIHADSMQSVLQRQVVRPEAGGRRPLFDVVVAYIHVEGKPVEGGDFDIQSLNAHLPPVPPLFQPVRADELKVPEKEASITGAKPGQHRTRVISYSGTGGTDWPTIEVPEGFTEKWADQKNMLWANHQGVDLLMPNLTRTMAINSEFDLSINPEPGLPRKFAHNDPKRTRVLVNTAEEWALYNCSQMLWCHSDRKRFPQPGSFGGHFVSYPISRKEGQERFAKDPEFIITTKGVDHPFHIHVNPMWVLRIDVPDENGDLHNILPEPAWMDTVPIPRHGGRVVFRTRFDDFAGQWVNHCHLLLHEDNGMMHMVDCQEEAEGVNYNGKQKVAEHGMSGSEVDAIYPKPSLELMYRQNLSFIDPCPLAYQEYPGFELKIPRLED